MKTRKTSALILTPFLFLGAAIGQADSPQLRIEHDEKKCELRLEVDADLRHGWICGVLVSTTERRSLIFADKAPLLSDAMIMAVGESEDGRFAMDTMMSADMNEHLYFQAIVLDAFGGFDATTVLRVPPRRKYDADRDVTEDQERRIDADTDGRAGGLERPAVRAEVTSDVEPCFDGEVSDRLDLQILSTDSIPPWHSLLVAYKAPTHGYHLSVQRIDRDDQNKNVSVYLLLTQDPEANGEVLINSDRSGPELLYTGAELGFGHEMKVKVFFAVDCGQEPREYRLVRSITIEE